MSNSRANELRAELLRRELASRENKSQVDSNESPRNNASKLKEFEELAGVGRTPFSTIRDVGAGLLGGAQRLAATMGEAGQAIGGIAAPLRKYIPNALKVVPNVDVREELGLGKENPVDLENVLASKNSSGLAKGFGKFLPAIAAGGSTLPGQMAVTGVYGGLTASPNEENMLLPNGRIGRGIEDAALTGILGKVGQEVIGGFPTLKAAKNYIGKKLEYVRPNVTAKKFLQSLGKGTKEENVQSLAQDIQNAHQEKLNEALAHKTPVFKAHGRNDIYKTPETALPEGNLEKVVHYIVPGEKVEAEQLKNLASEIKKYRKSGNFENFIDNIEQHFDVDLKPNQVSNLENALAIAPKQDSQFFKIAEEKYMTAATKRQYQKFNKKQNLNNADDLQSQLGKQIGDLKERRLKQGLNQDEIDQLAALTEMRNALKKDMHGHLSRTNSKASSEYEKFTDKYRENVAHYEEEPATRAIVNESKSIREKRAINPKKYPFDVTSSQVNGLFSEPSREALQIAHDIGQEGRNKILYNLLANEANPTAKGLGKAILDAKQAKGYTNYITPEMEQLANALLKRYKLRKKINRGAGLALGGLGIYEVGKKF